MNNVVTRTEIAIRELEIERNIVKCLSSCLAFAEPKKRVIFVSRPGNPWVTAHAGNGLRQASTGRTAGAFGTTAGAY